MLPKISQLEIQSANFSDYLQPSWTKASISSEKNKLPTKDQISAQSSKLNETHKKPNNLDKVVYERALFRSKLPPLGSDKLWIADNPNRQVYWAGASCVSEKSPIAIVA
ncbi:unnamed protein product [Hermetia illucens]|uniref:Uncharacterized protein n=1 Tax=Hermetia illucens TaxID=343691 RepID=A0A7R8U9M3_HERIL|nr:unnamed protein product [Hermetia illucens]